MCGVCASHNPRNKRLRTSAFVELQEKDLPEEASPGPAAADPERVICRVLIDTGPDLRYQLLREEIRQIDAVLYTHTHADHIFGIDDLRGICYCQGHPIAAFAAHDHVTDLRNYFSYIFAPDPAYLGGAPPRIQLSPIEPYVPFSLAGVPILPLTVLHGKLEILGFRIGNFAYLTDCSGIPERTKAALAGLEVLFLSGLRARPHPTHLSLQEARREVQALAPGRTYLIHLSHEVDYETENEKLLAVPEPAVELAYDGLSVRVPAPAKSQ
jgi:phosphoribosyl 1,2-cyclic phosphate phosphodiesterase